MLPICDHLDVVVCRVSLSQEPLVSIHVFKTKMTRQIQTVTSNYLRQSAVAINLEMLFTNCMGSAPFALALLEELEASGMEHVRTIAKYALAEDCAATAEAAHSLKGAAGIIGAESLQSVAAAIESAGRSDDIDSVTQLVEVIRQEMERCLAQIPCIRKQTESASHSMTDK